MPLKKVVFNPGINRESTNYTNESRYWDSNLARFRSGFPEKLGGWSQAFPTAPIGVVRKFHNWYALDGSDFLAIGTSKKLYIENGGTLSDITPIRRTVTLGNPFTTISGSNIVTVTDTSNGVVLGDYVTISGVAAALNGIPATEFNKEQVVASIIDNNTYTIQLTTNATSSGTPTAASITFTYQVNIGLDVAISGVGWGAGPWSRGTWGSAATMANTIQMRLWAIDNFGEDALACVRDGSIYAFDYTAGAGINRATYLTAAAGASNVPTVATGVFVTEDRHVVAYGANALGSSVQDRVLVRWSNQEDWANWTPASTNTAGDYRLSTGSYIVGHAKTRQETLIWTDQALYSMQFIGPPYTFGFTNIGTNVSLLSPNAMVTANNITYWMGDGKFYMYDGRVQTLPCAVRSYIFSDFNTTQAMQVCAGTNEKFNELWWFYPSASSSVPNKYVIFNYLENTWVFGSLTRTAWLDLRTRKYPVAAAATYIVYHEYGVDDNETGTPAPMDSYIETADFDIADGTSLSFVKRIIPDVSFENSTATAPTLDLQVTARDYPGGNYFKTTSTPTTRTTTVPIEQYTTQAWIRIRGRQMALRLESNTVGVQWQLGAVRLDLQPDGRR